MSVSPLHLAVAAVDGPVPAAAAAAALAGAATGTAQASPVAASAPHSGAAARSPPVTLPAQGLQHVIYWLPAHGLAWIKGV